MKGNFRAGSIPVMPTMKFNFGKHQSLGNNVKKSIKWVCSQNISKGIKIGITEVAKHRYPKGYLRIMREVPGGILINAYDEGCITKIFIVSDRIDLLKTTILSKWN